MHPSEALFIGFLGGAIDSFVAIVLGGIISDFVAEGPLSDLAGLRILAFDPAAVVVVMVLVMGPRHDLQTARPSARTSGTSSNWLGWKTHIPLQRVRHCRIVVCADGR
ncbi:MAG: hypothetical protein WD273_03865 [Trueperaceae bacterium]